MHPFPHHYAIHAVVRPDCDVQLSLPGVRVIESAPPKEFDTHAKLQVPPGADIERAKKLLEKAEFNCLIANSLCGERHLTSEVEAG